MQILNEPVLDEKFDVVVSFATHKLRIDKGELYQSMDSIVNQEFNGKFHVVVNLWKPDYESAPQKLKDYFNKHNIEVILTDIDYKTHNKYVFVFEKYRGTPIATFDDDQIYRKDALQLMFDTHKRHPHTLIGGFCVIPGGIVNKKTGERGKPRPLSGSSPDYGIQIWGSGGNFYPPEFTEKITLEMIEEWIRTKPDDWKYDNDMYLFRMAKKFMFKGMVVECSHKRPTWRGYLVEKFLSTADDDTAKTWKKKRK